jgi:hypothetical protein
MAADDATLPEVFRGIQRLEGRLQGMDEKMANLDGRVQAIGLDVSALKAGMNANISAQSDRTRARDVRCADHSQSLGDLDNRVRQMETTTAAVTTTVVEARRLPNWITYVALAVPSVALLWELRKG